MAEDVQLTSQQTDKLLQFQDLTGIEDIERCRNILESHNWDLEVATQDTLNMREGSPSVYRPLPRTPPSVNASPPDQRVFLAIRPYRPSTILGWGYLFISFPFQFMYSTFMRLARFALSFIRADPRRILTDPLRDVSNFIQNYEEKYGTMHPIFYRGTYYQAVNDAKQDLKFLLVYLHGDDHQDTDHFCSTVLSNPEIVNFVNTSFIFWGCSVNSPEGYRVSQALRCTVSQALPFAVSQALRENTYPFLAIIVLRDNRMTVVARIEGRTQPSELISRLQIIMNDNEASLIAARHERHERSVTQTIRQQQDEAYQESLRADQEKEKKRREEQELKAQKELEERNKIIEEQKRKEEIQRRKIELLDEMPPEPPEDNPNTVRLKIKLPTGTMLERRFEQDQSLKFLYYFVFCHAESPNSFQIVSNFPRRKVPCEPTESCPEPPSFAEFGFGRSEMLFVHDLEA